MKTITTLLTCLTIASLICTCVESCSPSDGYETTISPNLTNYAPGDKVTYTCNFCYEPDFGDFRRECKSDGTWTGSVPYCKVRNADSFEPGPIQQNITQHYAHVVQTPKTPGDPKLAVDGSLDTYTTIGGGREYEPSWNMVFCTKMLIDAVKIYTRKKDTGESGALKIAPYDEKLCNILVKADDVVCGEIKPPYCLDPGDWNGYICLNIPLKYMKRTLSLISTDGKPFSLAEIEVFADVDTDFITNRKYLSPQN